MALHVLLHRRPDPAPRRVLESGSRGVLSTYEGNVYLIDPCEFIEDALCLSLTVIS